MTEPQREAEQVDLATTSVDQMLYYDYESRFIRQNMERDRIKTLPRVVVPALFAPNGHPLGDVRVFERLTVGPVSALTCRLVELAAGEATPRERRVPTLTMYVLEGSGRCVEPDAEHEFQAGDVVFIPPYREYSIVAGDNGLRAWVPESRMWHALGLLWHEHHEPAAVPGEVVTEHLPDGTWSGYRIPRGTLGLQEDLIVNAGADPRRAEFFAARRAAPQARDKGTTRYDYFLDLQDAERQSEQQTPRVLRGADLPWESTRQGRLKYYLTTWTQHAGQDLELMAYDIPPASHTGSHRHVAEELLYVARGQGHDVHDGIEYRWHAGDLICIPPMAVHQHVNDGTESALLVSAWLSQPAREFLGGIEHIKDASGWAQS